MNKPIATKKKISDTLKELFGFDITALTDEECRALNISPDKAAAIAESIANFIGNLPEDQRQPDTASAYKTNAGRGDEPKPLSQTLPAVLETLVNPHF